MTQGPKPEVEKPKKRKKRTVVKSQQSVEYRRSEIVQSVRNELRVRNLVKSWISFWRLIPRIVWSFFIEALLVCSFRYEWGRKFRGWTPWSDLHRHDNTHAAKVSTVESVPLQLRSSLRELGSTHTITTGSAAVLTARHDHHLCSRLKINVGGQLFETQLRSLHRFPNSLLGDADRRIVYYDPTKQHYFFDRNRACFENILYFYQSGGRLICPREINADEFLEEIEFFDLGADVIKNFSVDEGMEQEDELANIKLPKNLLLRKLWLLLEYPNSSAQATLVSIISVYVILISVIVFCIETEPMFREDESGDDAEDLQNYVNVKDPLTIIETICVAWFTSELILRCIVCPHKWEFLQDAMNVVDMLAILPYLISYISSYFNSTSDQRSNEGTSLSVIRVIRLVRVFRIFKLSRHVKGMKILGWTLKASFNELGLLIFFLLIGVVLFSSAVYFAEEGQNSSFQSIPQAFFWAVTTMTTVGYGDMVPVQVGGKIVGSLCAIAGVLTLALPVPVMVSNFNYFYNQEISRSKSIDRMETNHVQMCPYLPNAGLDPRELQRPLSRITLVLHDPTKT